MERMIKAETSDNKFSRYNEETQQLMELLDDVMNRVVPPEKRRIRGAVNELFFAIQREGNLPDKVYERPIQYAEINPIKSL